MAISLKKVAQVSSVFSLCETWRNQFSSFDSEYFGIKQEYTEAHILASLETMEE